MRLIVLWSPVAAAAVLTAGVTLQPWVDPRIVFLDPLAAAQTAPCCNAYFGAMSTLGVLAWSAAAGLCALTAAILWARADRRAGFFLAAAALTGWMALDDALMIHEVVGPRLGLAQNGLLAVYAGLGAAYLWFARRRLFEPGGLLLAAAVVCFALSLGVDVVWPSTHSQITAIEDGAKFIGIVAWLMFHAAAAFDAMTETAPARAGR